MTAAQDYADALVAALEDQGLRLEQYYAELGHGQQEISTAHAAALQAADEQVLVRETIRGVAAQQGLVASLAPKPWPDNAGNGAHVHFSLWEGDRNRFYAGGRAVGAGALVHRRRARASAGLVRADRAELQLLPPDRAALLGGRVRLLGLRQPRGTGARRIAVPGRRGGLDQRRAQGRDSSANPYLALGGLIASGLDGVERGLEPPEPVDVDPATLGEHERARRAIRPLPATQAEALDALAADEVLIAALGPVLARSYLAVRRSEWAAYAAEDTEFEHQGHFEKY